MYTAGYETENKTKPKITLEIESTDDGLTADQAALGLLKGRRVFKGCCANADTVLYRSGERRGAYYC
jgi:3-dehydrosphinganine reductase